MHKWVQGHRGTAACRNSCRSDASDAARSRAPGLLRWLATHHFRAMPTRRPRKRKKKDGGVVEVEAEPASTAVGAGGGIAAAARDTAAARAQRLQPDADNRSDEAHQLGGDGAFIPSGVLVGHRILRLFGNVDGADDECVGGQDGCLILRTPMSKEAEEVDSAFFIGTVRSYRPPKAYEQLMPKNAVGGSSSSSSSAHGVHVDGDGPKKGGRRRGSKKKKKRGGRPRKDAVRELDYALYRVHFDDGDVMDMEPKEVFECSQLYDAKVSGRGVVRRNEETTRLCFSSDICHIMKLLGSMFGTISPRHILDIIFFHTMFHLHLQA